MKYMKNLIFILAILPFGQLAAQSKTTETLQKRNPDALVLFFYNNTLRMLNQSEDKAFDEMIRDIEKMKFLMIKKSPEKVEDYKKLVSEYKAEQFEEMMTSRIEGKNFDIFMRDKKDKGMLVLINDEENLFVLDIVGSIALNRVTELYNTLDKSTEIGKKIKAFTDDGDEEEDLAHH